MAPIDSKDRTRASLAELTQGQHSRIFEGLDRIRTLFEGGCDKLLLIDAIDELREVTRAHFLYEEKLPDFGCGRVAADAHQASHAGLLDHIASLRHHAQCFDQTTVLYELRFLDRWMRTHISEEVLRSALNVSDDHDDWYGENVADRYLPERP